MKKIIILSIAIMALAITSCNNDAKNNKKETTLQTDTFKYLVEQFADIRVLRYNVPGFEQLSLQQKELLYYLYEAALSGRDIIYDQNYKHNLRIRKTLEAIFDHYKGDVNNDNYKALVVYAKRFWVSNGIHHHYSSEKFIPGCTKEYFAEVISSIPVEKLPFEKGQTIEDFTKQIIPIIFDPNIDFKKVSLDATKDLLKNSAVNYYEGVTQKEVEDYYAKRIDKNDPTPISWGLNSKMVKENGKLVEKVYKVGGLYTQAIEKIVYWLEKASTVTETEAQKLALLKLIEFFKTGDLKTFDDYSILWLKDTESIVDVVNGFIEVYEDPLGKRGAYQSVVSIKDLEATKRAKTISENAKWFEENSPIAAEFKKKDVKGVTAKVINVVVESGDCSPTTPIGVNLPNSDWIRKDHGSKSVTIGNIVHAYDEAAKLGGAIKEFAFSQAEIDSAEKYSSLGGNLHTDLHEVIGHGSGQLKPGVADPSETLKNYASALEEARADLVALYYIMDPKLVELGIMPSIEVGKVEYASYIRNGLLVQLSRIELGKDVEQAHMRCRKLIASWAYEQGKKDNVIEKKVRDGKTYFVVNDYDKLRTIFGNLLAEVQRIKSEGDYEAGKNLVENYGVKIDLELHKEVKARWEKLGIAPYAAFINPKLVPVMENGKIVDVKIEYPTDFMSQMMEYGRNYALLPVVNK